MATVTLYNSDISLLNSVLLPLATTAPRPTAQAGAPDPTTGANYGFSVALDTRIVGYGFVYDQLGRLAGGTITGITASSFTSGSSSSSSGGFVSVTGGSEAVAQLLQLYNLRPPQGFVGEGAYAFTPLLAGPNAYYSRASTVTGSNGDDVFHIIAPGEVINRGVPGSTVQDPTAVTISGNEGDDTAVFDSLRNVATVTTGSLYAVRSLTSTVTVPGITASAIQINSMQFIDGTALLDPGSVAARSVLAFKAVFGRAPDSINAGGFGLLAQQQGLAAAAAAMLATPEGAADTTGLSNGDFVARVYGALLYRTPDQAGRTYYTDRLNTGDLSRGAFVAVIAGSGEAYADARTSFASTPVFAANPNAVDVLRTYDVLLGRLPEASSLTGNTQALDIGAESLAQLYATVQNSTEFAAAGPNAYGITATSSYAVVFAALHSDTATTLVLSQVGNSGVAHQ